MKNDLDPAMLALFDRHTLPDASGLEDPVFLQEIYQEFLGQLAELAGYFASPDRCQENRTQTALLAHRLKSSAAAVGAQQLSACLKEIEQAATREEPVLESLLLAARQLLQPTEVAVLQEIDRLAGSRQ